MAETGEYADPEPLARIPESGVSSSQSLTVLPDGTKPVPLGSGTILGVLGEGGAAIVYEIWNDQLGVKRAVKVLRPNAMAQSFERFTTEMRITAQLRHPNIIEIHSVGQWNNLPFIEMERLEGASLDKILQKYGALPVPVAVAIAIMVCRALKYTHNHDYVMGDKHYKGILHRDLKPANTMIAANGVAKLMDFGIATPANASMHTMEGTFVGSLQYLAPEQLEGKKASPSSDLYALGAMMYEMLTGTQAFPERNMTKLISMRLKNEYKPLQDYRLHLPKVLLKCVNWCMAFERERRASDAGEVLETLERVYARFTRRPPEAVVEYYLHQMEAGGTRTTITFRRRLPILRIAGGVAAGIALGVGARYLWAHPEVLSAIRQRLVAPVAVRDTTVLVQTTTVAETVFVPKPQAGVPRQQTAATPAPANDRKPAVVYSYAQQPAPPPQAGKTEPSFLVQLMEKYGTDDLLAIMGLEVGQGNYGSALRVYDSLSSNLMRSKRALIYRMRALVGLGNAARLGEFFEANTIPDAEYYLAKAQFQYGQRKYREALATLANYRSSQAEFADQRSVEREAVYCKAMCLTLLYEQDGSAQSRASAMEGWYDVKFALRNEQNHRYFEYANEQIRRMSSDAEQ